jgi:amino acid adenylation domain-containing protein
MSTQPRLSPPPADGPGDPEAIAMLARPIELPATPYPSVTDTILAWAERSPDQIALAHGERAWTYRALGERAQAIGSVLGQRSLDRSSSRAGDAVAIIGPPSPGLVASLVGALISRRVVVPIDPEIPPARRAVMLREARVTDAVIAGPVDDALGAVEPHARPACLRVDPDSGEIDAPVPRTGAGAGAPAPDDGGPAYVFYTSGTTGEPKGILGTGRGIAHFLHWQRRLVDVVPSDRFSHTTGISFDVMLREVLLPLYGGATLVIPGADALRSPLAWLRDARITIVHTVPSRAEHWLRRAEATGRTRVRAAFFAGEPLTSSLVRRWRLLAPDGEIINLYGPTETTLAKCFHRIPDEVEPGVQPIGRPLPETQVFIVAPDGSPCARGEAGEIAVRTPFRTLGYLNAPAEQQARFLVNPHRTDPADVLYRTGDRGRVRPDGTIEIHGRMDRQIKIRGARVELGEIEVMLGRHPGVAQAVVAVGDGPIDRTVDRQIVAFVVLAGASIGPDDLQAFLRAQLPAWMVPSVIIPVDEMPLGRNGKTDKRALLAVHAERAARRRQAERAPTPTEAVVIEQVRQVLAVGARPADDFFRLGGDSRAAARLVARLERELGVSLPVPLVFEHPVIADLARALDDASEPRDIERIEL